jgi:hypothetical protein
MHRQEHFTFLIRDKVMFDARPKHEQIPYAESMRLTLSGYLEMALEDLNGHDPFGPVRRQAGQVAEYEKRHCRGILLIQCDLSVTFLARLGFPLELQGDGAEVERMLGCGKPVFRLRSQTCCLWIFHDGSPFNVSSLWPG